MIEGELAKFQQQQAQKYAQLQTSSQWLTLPLPSPNPAKQQVRAEERQQLTELKGEQTQLLLGSINIPYACQQQWHHACIRLGSHYMLKEPLGSLCSVPTRHHGQMSCVVPYPH